MAVTASVRAYIKANETAVNDTGTARFPSDTDVDFHWSSGVGANQVDRLFSDRRTLADGANEDLDLAGVLSGALAGPALTFAKIKAILIVNRSQVRNITVSQPANGVPLLGGEGNAIVIPPGGFFMMGAPGTNGLAAVTAGTEDLLNVANAAGGASDYEIVVLGTSA
jgi:hypothetical protein